MENRKQTTIKKIERVLTDKMEKVTTEQRKALALFDRFNDLERGTSLSTRLSYLTILYKLGQSNKKPFEQMEKRDLEEFLSVVKGVEKKSSFELRKAHIKRFFRWLHWHIQGEDGKLQSFVMPKCV
jgi:site-specific recombinase XerD